MSNSLHRQIRKKFNRSVKTYSKVCVLQHEVASRLLSRLDYIKITPKRILDCGAREGFTTNALEKRYPRSCVIACDISEALLGLRKKRLWQKLSPRVCVDYVHLPFKASSFDLIYSNLALHWSDNFEVLLSEFKRILSPNGLLLFSTVGPDTLKELRASGFAVYSFKDMHDIGDVLSKIVFDDPVMDMEYLTLSYHSSTQLFNDLRYAGVSHSCAVKKSGLSGKLWMQQCQDYYQKNFDLTASVEVIYGHAWQTGSPATKHGNEVRVPLTQVGNLKKQRF